MKTFTLAFVLFLASNFVLCQSNESTISDFQGKISCEPPSNLDVWFDSDDGYVINSIVWDAPETIVPWYGPLNWDNGENYSGFGVDDGGSYSVAIRWDENMLSDGFSLDMISFYLSDSGFSNIVVKIWTGSHASNLVFQDTVDNPIINVWNQVTLDTLIYLDPTLEYWVGYRVVNQSVGNKPVGRDSGPGVQGYGDMFSPDEEIWDFASTFTDSWNWNIQLWVSLIDTSNNTLNGFNLYRLIGGDEDYEYYDFIPAFEWEQSYQYFDTVEDFKIPDHCYKVNALWVEDGDSCVSDFARSIIPIYDFACIIYESTPEIGAIDFEVYPNPTTNKLSIYAESEIESVTILNLQGQVVQTQSPDNPKESDISVESLAPGLYLLKVKTSEGVGVKKILKN